MSAKKSTKIDPVTGEITDVEIAAVQTAMQDEVSRKPSRPYQTSQHLAIKSEITWQMQYIADTLGSPDDKSRFAALSADLLSLALGELTAMYTSLSRWLADEKLHLDDLRAHYDVVFANCYLDEKDDGETNETARYRAKIKCQPIVDEINKYKHGYAVIEAWKKSIGRWHDTCRSQLSYEKQSEIMGRGIG